MALKPTCRINATIFKLPFFILLTYATSRLACLYTDNLQYALQNLNSRYPGYSTSYRFTKYGNEEKWIVVSFADLNLTTLDKILNVYNLRLQYGSLITPIYQYFC